MIQITLRILNDKKQNDNLIIFILLNKQHTLVLSLLYMEDTLANHIEPQQNKVIYHFYCLSLFVTNEEIYLIRI